jgi:hypothetical protein
MKTNRNRINWLIPALGIALVALGLSVGAIYLELEGRTRSAEASMARMVRLRHDLELCAVLRTFHEGNVTAAARQLDLLLCSDIVTLNAHLASTDAEERSFVKNAFARFALVRPLSAQLLADDENELREEQIEAERILAQAGGGAIAGINRVTVVP